MDGQREHHILMAHFAEIDDAGIVLQVVVVSNEALGELPFPESEPIGIAFCQSLFGADTRWLQTSYSGGFRGTYAGVGYRFDAAAGTQGAFIAPIADETFASEI
jgi:hypothetical protein